MSYEICVFTRPVPLHQELARQPLQHWRKSLFISNFSQKVLQLRDMHPSPPAPLQNEEESEVYATKESEVSTPEESADETKDEEVGSRTPETTEGTSKRRLEANRKPVQSTLPSSRRSPKARIPITLLWSTGPVRVEGGRPALPPCHHKDLLTWLGLARLPRQIGDLFTKMRHAQIHSQAPANRPSAPPPVHHTPELEPSQSKGLCHSCWCIWCTCREDNRTTGGTSPQEPPHTQAPAGSRAQCHRASKAKVPMTVPLPESLCPRTSAQALLRHPGAGKPPRSEPPDLQYRSPEDGASTRREPLPERLSDTQVPTSCHAQSHQTPAGQIQTNKQKI